MSRHQGVYQSAKMPSLPAYLVQEINVSTVLLAEIEFLGSIFVCPLFLLGLVAYVVQESNVFAELLEEFEFLEIFLYILFLVRLGG